jgi:alkylation response protein AidB-like acyl-CoA dehydrogenase
VADTDEIVEAVREFFNRAWTPERRVASLKADGADEQLWQQAAEQGWFALTAPEPSGGMGLPPSVLAALSRLFGALLVTGPLLEQMLLPGLLLAAADGDAPAASERLVSALAGETRLALVDAGATIQWARPIGGVTVTDGKINGCVELVRFGSEADALVVIAANGLHADVLVVDPHRAGITVVKRPSADPGASYASVVFDDVVIEAGEVIAGGSAGTALADSIRSWLRVLIACELSGIARHLLNLSVEYVQQREQFGRPVGTFQAIKHLAASTAQRVIQLESFCDAVTTDSKTLTPEAFALAASTLKANAAESARLASEDALQMHGGIGFTYEYELHWYYKRALALRSWFGDERELAVEIGRSRLSA